MAFLTTIEGWAETAIAAVFAVLVFWSILGLVGATSREKRPGKISLKALAQNAAVGTAILFLIALALWIAL